MNDPCPPSAPAAKEGPSVWIAKAVAEMKKYIQEIVDNVGKMNTGSTSVSDCLFYVEKACKRILCMLRMRETAMESTRVEQKNLEDARGPLRSGYGQAIEAAIQRVADAERHEAYAKLVAGPIHRAITDAIHTAIESGTLDLLSPLVYAIDQGELLHKTEIEDKGLTGGSFPFFVDRAIEILTRVTDLVVNPVPEEDEPGVPDSSAAAGGAGKGRKTRKARKTRKTRSKRTRRH